MEHFCNILYKQNFPSTKIFENWHTQDYMLICLCNSLSNIWFNRKRVEKFNLKYSHQFNFESWLNRKTLNKTPVASRFARGCRLTKTLLLSRLARGDKLTKTLKRSAPFSIPEFFLQKFKSCHSTLESFKFSPFLKIIRGNLQY